MKPFDDSFHKAYMQGYFSGYRDARRDMKNGINQLNIESDFLSHPIEGMGLCVRTYNCLERAGFHYVDDIASLSESRIIAIRGLGAKGRAEIARWLDSNGISNTAWYVFL